MLSKQDCRGLVLYVRFPVSKKSVKTSLEELAKKKNVSVNKLSIQILEKYTSQFIELEKYFPLDAKKTLVGETPTT